MSLRNPAQRILSGDGDACDDMIVGPQRPDVVAQVKEVLHSMNENQRSILPLAMCKLKRVDGDVVITPRLGKNKHEFVTPLLEQFGQEEMSLTCLIGGHSSFNYAFDASKLIMKTLKYDGYPRVQDALDWLVHENILPLLDMKEHRITLRHIWE